MMIPDDDINTTPERSAGASLLLIIITVAAGFIVVGPLIGVVISFSVHNGDFTEYITALQNIQNHPELKLEIYIIQGCSTFIGLVLMPALFLISDKRKAVALFKGSPALLPVLLTAAIVVAFMGFNSIIIEWNAKMNLPGFLKSFEDWAREKENDAGEMVKILTNFQSVTEFLIAMLVIALLPAIGEEFVFRGLIQNELFRGTRNIHLSIWLSAFLFSAIHLQFFGFFPRMFLGALFGYLYYWSGNLSLAMLAHFLNNGISVAGMYLYEKGTIETDMEGTDAMPWPMILASTALTAALLFTFYKYYHDRRERTIDTGL